MPSANKRLSDAIHGIFAGLKAWRAEKGQAEKGQAEKGAAFPPALDDIIRDDLALIGWRVVAPPAQVEAVYRCYGEAVASVLYTQSDGAFSGVPMNEDARWRMFLRGFRARLEKLPASGADGAFSATNRGSGKISSAS